MRTTPGIEVRAVTNGSAAEAAELLMLFAYPDDAECSHRDQCRQTIERLLANPQAHFWLASVERRYVGFVALAWSVSASTRLPVLRVEGLYTLPEYRCREVASVLLDHATDLARRRGSHRLLSDDTTGTGKARNKLFQLRTR